MTTGTTDTSQTGAFANPNRAINNTGLVAYDYPDQFRIDGSYRVRLLGGFLLSGVYNNSAGHAWGRRATIRNLNQGTETVRIEPRGTRRNVGINQLDLRISKQLKLGESRAVEVYGDIFNVNNQGAPIRLFGTLGIVDSGRNLRDTGGVDAAPHTASGRPVSIPSRSITVAAQNPTWPSTCCQQSGGSDNVIWNLPGGIHHHGYRARHRCTFDAYPRSMDRRWRIGSNWVRYPAGRHQDTAA